MMDARRVEDLRLATRSAVARQVRQHADAAGRQGHPAAAGDVFLSPVDPASPFEWAVLERRGDALRIVPADTMPIVGSRDVSISAGASGGPLVLRCDLACWLPAARLDEARRSAVLASRDLRRALGRCRETELLGEAAAPTEADEDPEYLEWEEEAAASAELLRTAAAPEPRAAARWWSLATAALLLVAAGAGLGWLGARHDEDRPATALANVPFVWLVPEERFRGEVAAPAPAERPLVLIIEVPALAAAREYRLTVFDDAGRELRSLDGLRRTGVAELSVLLPSGYLGPGTYLLRVADADAAAAEPPLAELRLRLEADAEAPGSP